MPSKLDQLRSGIAVEVKPGLSAQLDRENKRLHLSTGEYFDVADNPRYFPRDDQELNQLRQREQVEKEVAQSPFGEFGHQFATQGLVGGARDWRDYLTKSGTDYAARKQAEREVSQRISKESPYTSAAATAASFIPDLVATRGMSALKAAPLLVAGSSGSRLVTEPGEVAKEAAIGAAGGLLLDKATGYMSRIAQRRGAIRELPSQQQAVREANILGEQAIEQANLLQKQQHNILTQNIKQGNSAKLSQHEAELLDRQNQILKEKNDFISKKAKRDSEITRLKNLKEQSKILRSSDQAAIDREYENALNAAKMEDKKLSEQFKLQQEQYNKLLEDMPRLQKLAQKEYSENVLKNANKISESFPKDSKIYTSQFNTEKFIEDSIRKSELAGSKEASQASKILKSIFPEGEIITPKEIANRYKSLEGAIQKSNPEVAKILNQYKEHLGSSLSSILSDNISFYRVMPSIRSQIEKEVNNILNEMPLSETGLLSRPFMRNKINSNINVLFNQITPENFYSRLTTGDLKNYIRQNILKSGDLATVKLDRKVRATGAVYTPEELLRMGVNVPDPAQKKYDEFFSYFNTSLDKILSKAEQKLIGLETDVSRKLGAKIKKTQGMAAELSAPIPPVSPEPVQMPAKPIELPPVNEPPLPPPIAPPVVPSMPPKPQMMNIPSPPTPQSYSPLQEPVLPPSQGLSDSMGDLLEKKLLGGKGVFNNPITKLAGLKYLLGSAALPVEGAYGAMKALTTPGAAGEAIRSTFKMGGIEAIDRWAQQYPSYQNGILLDPQDRRSLTKEIEDAQDIPLEQKAVLQSKINRGKPIQGSL